MAKRKRRVPTAAAVKRAKEKTPPPKSAGKKGGVSKAASGIKHPGATTAAARRAGLSVHQWAEKHKHSRRATVKKRADEALMFEREGKRKKKK